MKTATLGSTRQESAWPRVGATPAELVHREGTLRLLRYRAEKPVEGRPALLVVPPVINRANIVDLTPARSLVAAFASAGIETFVVDWGRPRLADRTTGLDELVTKLLPRVEKRALEACGLESIALLGYCLGGTIATCRATLATGLAGLVTLHAPVSFADAGLLGTLTGETFPLDALLNAFGNMPGEIIQSGFLAMKPLQKLGSLKAAWDRLEDPDALEEVFALEAWNRENVPVTGAFYKRLIDDLYRNDKLAKGTLELSGKRVALDAIRCPVLVVSAVDDPICLPAQADALLDLATKSPRKEKLSLRGGHIRSVVGKGAPERLATAVVKFLDGAKS